MADRPTRDPLAGSSGSQRPSRAKAAAVACSGLYLLGASSSPHSSGAYIRDLHLGLSYTRCSISDRGESLSCFPTARNACLGLVNRARSQVTIERPVVTGRDARADLLA